MGKCDLPFVEWRASVQERLDVLFEAHLKRLRASCLRLGLVVPGDLREPVVAAAASLGDGRLRVHVGIEGSEVFRFLAGTDEAHGNLELVCHGEDDAALGRAVKLRQAQRGDRDDVRERFRLDHCVLAGRRVERDGHRLLAPDNGCAIPLPEPPPAEPVDAEELQQAINTLGDEFKIVVLMFYFEHRSYREIAELLDIPSGTVMSRLARAKAHLRRRLSANEQNVLERATSKLHVTHDRPTAIRP